MWFYLVWFLCFNGLSTFVGYLMPKIYFPMGISPKLNVIAQLESKTLATMLLTKQLQTSKDGCPWITASSASSAVVKIYVSGMTSWECFAGACSRTGLKSRRFSFLSKRWKKLIYTIVRFPRLLPDVLIWSGQLFLWVLNHHFINSKEKENSASSSFQLNSLRRVSKH